MNEDHLVSNDQLDIAMWKTFNKSFIYLCVKCAESTNEVEHIFSECSVLNTFETGRAAKRFTV